MAHYGYRISGRFPFGSGCRHADWMVLTALVSENGDVGPWDPGESEVVSLCVPRSSVTLHDNWDACAMIRFPDIEAFIGFAADPEYLVKAPALREAALERTLWMVTQAPTG